MILKRNNRFQWISTRLRIRSKQVAAARICIKYQVSSQCVNQDRQKMKDEREN